MEWLRWYSGTSTDPKLRTIAKRAGVRMADVLAVWATMLEAANDTEERGTLGSWCAEDVATALDMEEEDVERIAAAMQGKTLDGTTLSGWEKRQPKREDPTATERKRRQRKRLRESVTEQDSESEEDGHAMSRNVTTDKSRREVTNAATGAASSEETDDDPPEPKPKPRRPRKAPSGWSAAACDAWIDRFGGTAPGGRIGKALKPLVATHGEQRVLTAWGKYLAGTEPEYASPQTFASKFGLYANGTRSAGYSNGAGSGNYGLPPVILDD